MKKTNLKLYELLEYIEDSQKNDSYNPSIREMCNYLNVNSTCTIDYYLKKLINLGIIKKENHKSRAIKILLPKDKWKEALNIKTNYIQCDFNNEIIKNNNVLSLPVIKNMNDYNMLLNNKEIANCKIIDLDTYNNNLFVIKIDKNLKTNLSFNENDILIINRITEINENDTIIYENENNFYCELFNESKAYNNILGKVILLLRNY